MTDPDPAYWRRVRLLSEIQEQIDSLRKARIQREAAEHLHGRRLYHDHDNLIFSTLVLYGEAIEELLGN